MATHWLGKHSRNGLQVVAASREDVIRQMARIFDLGGLQRATLAASLHLKLRRNGYLEIETCDCLDGTHVEEPKKTA